MVIVPLALLLDVINIPFALLFLALAYGYAILVTLAAMVAGGVGLPPARALA